jgi:hypothetical protein
MTERVERLARCAVRVISSWREHFSAGILWGCLPVLAIVATMWTAAVVLADDWWYVYPPYPLESERFGVGLAGSAESVLWYDLEALGVGWYVNWDIALHPPHPYGTGFMQTIRLDAGNLSSFQSIEMITATIQANPGAVWQIGNEPDSIWLDKCTPEQYARAYYEYYHLVKAYDPTAKVAFGGLVQATPLRMLYLDHVWQAYQNLYGEDMPVDVWVVHGFIFPEVVGGWGADIPPGMGADADKGMQYEMRDHDDMLIFAEQIVCFRQWMADHGQREKPLLVNEYGIALWSDIIDEDGEDFSDDRVIAFMHATFDYFLTATDPDLGYPADGNRLVQGWAWYSLHDDVYQDGQWIGEGYNGDLFTGAYTKTITALGQGFAAYVQALGESDYADLWPLQSQVSLAGATWGQTGTVSLTTEVANYGRLPAQMVEVQFWDGEPGVDGVPIGQPVIPQVPGRYEGTGVANLAWSTLVSGTHTVWIEIDPQNQVEESDDENNQDAVAVDMTVDLSLTFLHFDPSLPLKEGSVLTITAATGVTNTGWVGIPAGVEVWFWMERLGERKLAASETLGPIAAGGGSVVQASWPLTVPHGAAAGTVAGVYQITAEVDPLNVVVETDEGNNSLEGLLLIAAARIYLPVVLRASAP